MMPTPEQLTPSQRSALERHQEQISDDEYEYQDNHRLARKHIPAEVADYEAAEGKGCCGSYDEEIVCDDGTTLMYGFNYGH